MSEMLSKGYLLIDLSWWCCAVQPRWKVRDIGSWEAYLPERWRTAPNKNSVTVHNVFTERECDAIIAWTKTQTPVPTISDVLDKKRKATLWRISNRDKSNSKMSWVTRRMIALMLMGNARKWRFPMTGSVEPIYIVMYEGAVRGKMDWHWDAHRNSNRLLSATVQLSKPGGYQGGYLVLGDHVASTDRGTFTLFPSYVMHTVAHVDEGSRYALVAYFKGRPINSEHKYFAGFARSDLDQYAEYVKRVAEYAQKSSSLDLLVSIGEFQRRYGSAQDARASFTSALKIAPLNAVAHSSMGSIYRSGGDLKKAKRSVQMALNIDPQLGDAHNNLGTIYKEERDYGRAEKSFKDALNTNRQNAQWHTDLGMLYMRIGNSQENLNRAKVRFQVALRIDPALVEAYTYLGMAQFALWDLPEAQQSWEKAAKLNPSLADPYHHLGMVAIHENRHPEAIGRFKTALKIDPSYVDAHSNLATAYQMTGHLRKARIRYEHALKLFPLLSDAWFKLGRIHRFQGDHEKAEANFAIARALDPTLLETALELPDNLDGMNLEL